MDQHCIALMSEFRKDGPSLIIWAVASRAGGQIEEKKKKKSWKPGSQGTKWGELKADDRLLVYHLDIQSRAPYAMA